MTKSDITAYNIAIAGENPNKPNQNYCSLDYSSHFNLLYMPRIADPLFAESIRYVDYKSRSADIFS
jgi:hypothetical protein